MAFSASGLAQYETVTSKSYYHCLLGFAHTLICPSFSSFTVGDWDFLDTSFSIDQVGLKLTNLSASASHAPGLKGGTTVPRKSGLFILFIASCFHVIFCKPLSHEIKKELSLASRTSTE